jgi:phage protein D
LNESDLAFLMRLSAYFGATVRMHDGRLRVRAEEADPEPVAVNAQDNARSIRLIADLNHQHGRTKVMGFNPDTDEAVDHTADALSPAPRGTTAYDELSNLSWPADEVVPQPFPTTRGLAEAFARAHFSRQAERFLSGDVRCYGEPGLRAGREIELSGVSPRMAGTYRVAHCVHRFDGVSGYETHLRVTRAGWRA